MTNQANANPPSPNSPGNGAAPRESTFGRIVRTFRDRILMGLVVILPLLVTFWVIWWVYSTLDKYVIDPVAMLVLGKGRWIQGEPALPYWFETYAAPMFAVVIALVLLFACGVFAHSRFRRNFDKLALRVPVVSHIYSAVQNVVQGFDTPNEKPTPQRIVLIPFPHPGMRLPAIVTSSCRDVATQRSVLCVYVPTTPIPTSGFFLMIPEDEVTELNWDVQQTLQAIISGGITAPREVTYYRSPFETPAGPGQA